MPERHIERAAEQAERKEGIFVDMRRRITPFLSQTTDVELSTPAKCSKKKNLFAGSLHACQSIIYYLIYLTIAKISKLWQRKKQINKRKKYK